MAASLMISFLIAWLAVPLLADRFLNEADARQEANGTFRRSRAANYEIIMKRVLPNPVVGC
jgi:multidrug efflux pump subunit AcrB